MHNLELELVLKKVIILIELEIQIVICKPTN